MLMTSIIGHTTRVGSYTNINILFLILSLERCVLHSDKTRESLYQEKHVPPRLDLKVVQANSRYIPRGCPKM